MARPPKYDIGADSPFGVTGAPSSSPDASVPDLISGNLEQISQGDGTQSGAHPAKSQSKVLRYFE